jgi:hypothetical protein
VNNLNDFGNTALHFAAGKGNMEAIKWLVEHGAEVSLQNARGNTALQACQEARSRNHVEVADWLQKHESSEAALLTLRAAAGEETAAQGGGAGAGSGKKKSKSKKNKKGKKVQEVQETGVAAEAAEAAEVAEGRAEETKEGKEVWAKKEAAPQAAQRLHHKRLCREAEAICCEVCNRADGEESMLLCGDGVCHGCDLGWHIHCLTPPLAKPPKDDWYCNDCTSKGDAAKALVAGIKANDIAAIVRAVEAGASMTARLDERGYTALHIAMTSLQYDRSKYDSTMGWNVEALQVQYSTHYTIRT